MSTTPVAEAPPASPFERIGGHPVMQAITERFYDLIEQDPAYAELRAMHAAELTPVREALALFLAGWAGGPRDWFDANPDKCMMSIHAQLPISRQTAGQWAEAMDRAIAGTVTADREIAEAISEALSRMAQAMARA